MSDKVKLFCETKNYVKLFKIFRKKLKKCLGRSELFIQNHGFGKRFVVIFLSYKLYLSIQLYLDLDQVSSYIGAKRPWSRFSVGRLLSVVIWLSLSTHRFMVRQKKAYYIS